MCSSRTSSLHLKLSVLHEHQRCLKAQLCWRELFSRLGLSCTRGASPVCKTFLVHAEAWCWNTGTIGRCLLQRLEETDSYSVEKLLLPTFPCLQPLGHPSFPCEAPLHSGRTRLGNLQRFSFMLMGFWVSPSLTQVFPAIFCLEWHLSPAFAVGICHFLVLHMWNLITCLPETEISVVCLHS